MQWSFSRLNTFENCPKRFYYQYIEQQYHEPPQEHLQWGTHVHEELEKRMRDKTSLPLPLQKHEHYMQTFEKAGDGGRILVEQKLALTEDLQPVPMEHPDAWCRGIIDLAIIKDNKALIVDYKTGKMKNDFTQLHLFAKLLTAKYPFVEQVMCQYLWLKFNKATKDTVDVEKIEKKWGKIKERADRMMEAVKHDKFPERPSGLCGWCYARNCSFCPN